MAVVLWVSLCFQSTMMSPPPFPLALLAAARVVAVVMVCLPLLTMMTMVVAATVVVVEEEGEVEEMEEEDGLEDEDEDEGGEEGVETRTLTLRVARPDCFRQLIGRVHRVGTRIGLGVIRAICAEGRSPRSPGQARRGRG